MKRYLVATVLLIALTACQDRPLTEPLAVRKGPTNASRVITENQSPIADAGGPYASLIGAAVTFDGSASSDAEGSALSYVWDFGDGSPVESGVSPTHNYAEEGDYVATLTVSDGALEASTEVDVTIDDGPPVVNAGADVQVTDADQTGLNVEFLDSAGDGPWGLSLEVVPGDGARTVNPKKPIQPGTPFALSVKNPGPGTYLVIVSVIDNADAAGVDTVVFTVTSSNTAPVANAGGPYAGNEGAALAFDATASTDNEGNELTYSWNFGDGTPPASGVQPSHAFADNGTYTVTLTVSDGALTNVATTTASISNAPPTGTLASPFPANEGTPYVIAVTGASDPSSADVAAGLQFSFDCGNGLGFFAYGTQSTRTCAALDSRPRTVQVRIKDKDGAVTTLSASGDIVNVAPTVAIVPSGSTSIRRGDTFAMRLSFTDPWELDLPWRVNIDWGNGTQSTVSLLQLSDALRTRRYTTAGTFLVRVTVTDNDGGIGTSNTVSVTVSP